MRYAWFIGFRYLRPKHRHFLISVITGIATVGVMFAVAAPELVLSVMNGFEREVRRRIVNTNYNIFVMSRVPFEDHAAIMDSLAKHPGVVALSPFVRREAMLAFSGGDTSRRFDGGLLMGVGAARVSLTRRGVRAGMEQRLDFAGRRPSITRAGNRSRRLLQ